MTNFIDNKYLIVFSTGRGIGTYIFINEIIQARKLGITCLKVSAAKSERFNGFYTWARLGYSIDSPEDQEDFEQLISYYGRKEKSMIELMQTSEGTKFGETMDFGGKEYLTYLLIVKILKHLINILLRQVLIFHFERLTFQ